MKKGCLIAILSVITIGIILIVMFFWAFKGEYKTIEINQKIGGKLICEMEYIPDLHSWNYFINYKYETPSGKIIDLGQGVYSGRNWNEDEQLVEMNNLYILKTGNSFGSDKIIYGNIESNNWNQFAFTPQGIEKDSLWKSKKIKSLPNYWPHSAFVSKIENNRIIITYEYRINPYNTELSEKKIIEYELSEKPIMKKIN